MTTQPVIEAEIRTYKPDETSPHLTIPGEEISNTVEITRRIQEWKDVASLSFSANGKQYAGEITTGDKIVFAATLNSETYSRGSFGGASFGASSFGGLGVGAEVTSWSGFAGVPTFKSRGHQLIDVNLDMADFAFEVLSHRRIYREYEDRPIATGDDSNPGIVDELLIELTPELDRSQVKAVDITADREYNGLDMFDAFVELAKRGDALLASDGDALVFKPIDSVITSFELLPSDFGLIESNGTDTNLVNDLRVDGTEATDVDEAQEVLDSYTQVTDTSRIIHQLEPRKSRLDFIEVWTRNTSDDGVKVRIQQDDGGSPIAVDDETLDITGRNLASEFISEDDYTTFLLPREPLPSNPWLIIEGTGSDGHDIGVNASGVPTHRTHYPYPIAVRVIDADSQDEYRHRMGRMKRDDITSFSYARDIGETEVSHNAQPERRVTFDAESSRSHRLIPGDVVTLDYPEIAATGDYIITEVSHNYDPSTVMLSTDISAQHMATI